MLADRVRIGSYTETTIFDLFELGYADWLGDKTEYTISKNGIYLWSDCYPEKQAEIVVVTKKKIDLTPYNQMIIEGELGRESDFFRGVLSVSNMKNTEASQDEIKREFHPRDSEFQLDLTNVTGEHYVKIGLYSFSGFLYGKGSFTITNIIFE